MDETYVGGPTIFRLAPSDLTFLWEECSRCFWLKVVTGARRPSGPFPAVFGVFDRLTKNFFQDVRGDEIAAGLRPGRFWLQNGSVRSIPIRVPGHANAVVVRGTFDAAMAFDDATFGIIDFKTIDPKDSHIQLYGRQVHAYVLAAENGAPGNISFAPVTQIGLLCVKPVRMLRIGDQAAYGVDTHWEEIPLNRDRFMDFLSDVLDVLEEPSPPEADPDCAFCRYAADGPVPRPPTPHRPRPAIPVTSSPLTCTCGARLLDAQDARQHLERVHAG